MSEALGDKILDWLLYIFIASWGLGWILLLLIMLLEKLFPACEHKGEIYSKYIERLISPLMKYAIIMLRKCLSKLLSVMGIQDDQKR